MSKTLLLSACTAIAIAIATPALGQAQQGQAQAPQAQRQSANYSDAQLRTYAAAKAEIDRLGENPAAAQTTPILERHGIDAATYVAIGRAAAQDRSLAQRIASLPAHTSTQ